MIRRATHCVFVRSHTETNKPRCEGRQLSQARSAVVLRANSKDTVGDHFTNAVGILRAVQHGENRIIGVAYKFGADIVENGADRHDATRAWNNCDPAQHIRQ